MVLLVLNQPAFCKMCPPNVQSILALGNKTESALFQIAISFAENGNHVWLISPETFEKAPRKIRPPDKEVLQLITVMYLRNHQDLITHLNSIHLWRKTPNVIIVLGGETYCDLHSSEYNPFQSALVLTTLLDSAAVCSTRNGGKTYLIVACSEPKSHSKELQLLNDLYFSCFFHNTEDEEFCNKIMELCK